MNEFACRYGIEPADWSKALSADPEVHAIAILLANTNQVCDMSFPSNLTTVMVSGGRANQASYAARTSASLLRYGHARRDFQTNIRGNCG